MTHVDFLIPASEAPLVDLKRSPTCEDRDDFLASAPDAQLSVLSYLREQRELNASGASVPLLGFSIAALALAVPAIIAAGTLLGRGFTIAFILVILLAVVGVVAVLTTKGALVDGKRAAAVIWYDALTIELPQRQSPPKVPQGELAPTDEGNTTEPTTAVVAPQQAPDAPAH